MHPYGRLGGLSWLLGRWGHQENGQGGIGAVFMAVEICTREMDLTTVFPDVENRGGEVVIKVDELWERISGGEPGDGDGMAAHDVMTGSLGCLVHVIFVFPNPKKGGHMNVG